MSGQNHQAESVPWAKPSRREFLLAAAAAGAALAGGSTLSRAAERPAAGAQPKPDKAKADGAKPLFTISLAQWSLHNALFEKKLAHLDFPKAAKQDYGIDAVEYVNVFFEKKGDSAYVGELKKRCADLGVTSVLIMCDGEGAIGDPAEAARKKTVENHRKWVEAAAQLGCHSIRVNAQSSGSFEEQQKLAADGLRQLCEAADPMGINVIVENHGGLSSHGDWLVGVMKLTAHPRVGTLPDFGNFTEYDRYKGVTEMMPYAKAVSAKSWDFDPATGDHGPFDYRKLMKIVVDAGYRGRLGIEYEGKKLSEPDGIRATKALLEKIRTEMARA